MTTDDGTTQHLSGPSAAGHVCTSQYEIRVRGRLGRHWSAWFDGLDLASDDDGTTVISGTVADQAALARTRTVPIIPTVFEADAPGASVLTPLERRLAANVADRAMCYELSLKYDVVSTPDADLTVRSRVTRVDAKNAADASARPMSVKSREDRERGTASGTPGYLAGLAGSVAGTLRSSPTSDQLPPERRK